MTIDEIQQQIDELDGRLDRLRALYEQYFTGIERTEPFVQRKDVERRFQALRRTQIRNTAQRFKFQTLWQKYTTYQTYWGRICRKIEEGTYKRDMIRAQRYGANAPKREAEGDEVFELDDVELEDLDELVEDAEEHPTTPPAPAPSAPVAAVPRAAPAPAQRAPVRLEDEVPLELSLDGLGAPPSAARAPQPAPVTGPRAPALTPPGALNRPTPGAQPAPAPQPAGAPQPTRAPQPAPAPQPAAAARSAADTTGPRTAVQPQPGVRPPGQATPGVVRPIPQNVIRTEVSQPAANAAAPRPAQPVPVQRAAPAAAPVPAVAPRAATPAAAPARPAAEDPNLRSLYENYRASRRKQGEGEVTYEALAKQIRETMPRLAQKYPGQEVGLEVTVKDGKTILRPVLKQRK